MKANKLYNYECEHSHTEGHVITWTWPHGIVLVVNLALAMGYILNQGDKRSEFDAHITIAQMEDIIDQCQDMDDSLARFNNEQA